MIIIRGNQIINCLLYIICRFINSIISCLLISGSLVFCISYETNTRKKENETKNTVNGYVLGIGTALGNRDSGIDKPSNTQHSKYNSKYSFFHKSLFGSEFYKRHATGCNTLFVTAKHYSLILSSISIIVAKTDDY